ncbi:MAG: DUF1624 domain-containing protein [Cyclobacteriaceae bacterium]
MSEALVKNERLLTLDVFRGMTIAFMILVNNPGSWSNTFSPLRHSPWNGATPTDLVFPFFLFIVGVSVFFAFSKYGQTLNAQTSIKIAKRTAMIFLIGLALNYFPFYNQSLSELRIMGVLQRIALAYGIAAFLCLGVSDKHLPKVGILILLAYWGLLYFLGGDDPFSLENNIVRTVDLAIFGEAHIYGGYGIPFDPEGLLSTLPSIGTVIFGYLIGSLIKGESNNKGQLVKNLLLVGVLSIFVALIWDQYFAINKPIWSSSYVLYTGGIACLVIAILIELIDIRQYKGRTKAFVIFGMNPLIVYAFSGIISTTFRKIIKWENATGESTNVHSFMFNDVFLGILPDFPKLASLCYALFIVAICWLLAWVLYRKNIFIKV